MSRKKTVTVVALILAGSSVASTAQDASDLLEFGYQMYVWPCSTQECMRVKGAFVDAFVGSVDPAERTFDNLQEFMMQVQGIETERDLEEALEQEMLRRQTFGYGGGSPYVPNADIGSVGGVINGEGYQDRLNDIQRTYPSSDYSMPSTYNDPIPDYGGVGRIMEGDAYNESQDTGSSFYLPPSTYSAPPSFGGDAQTEAGFEYGTSGIGAGGIYNAPAGGGDISVPSAIGSPIYNSP